MNRYNYTEALELNKNGLSIMEISRQIGMNDFDVLDCINKNVFDNKIIIKTRMLPSGKIHYRLGIHNSYICEEAVKDFGLCNNKSAIMKFPKIDEQYLPHFVRGLLDTDSCFSISNNRLAFSYGSCSKLFMQKLLEILTKYCGINSIKISETIKSVPAHNFYSFKICNKKDPYAIGQWIYKDSENNRGERKYNIWFNYYN